MRAKDATKRVAATGSNRRVWVLVKQGGMVLGQTPDGGAVPYLWRTRHAARNGAEKHGGTARRATLHYSIEVQP